MKLTTRISTNDRAGLHLALTLTLGLATACSGGGGGGGGGGSHSATLGGLSQTGQLAAIDPGDASVELCTPLDLEELSGTIALAMDAARGRFYTHDFGRGTLVSVRRNGEYEFVGTNDDLPSAMAYNRVDDELIGVGPLDASRSVLMIIDTNTGRSSRRAVCERVEALAYDEGNDRLFGVRNIDSNTGTLYSIDATTGSSQELFSDSGLVSITGLTFDPVNRQLYGIRPYASGSPPMSVLKRIDIGSLDVADIASFPRTSDAAAILDIAIDPRNGRVYGLSQGSELLELGGNFPVGERLTLARLSRRIDAMAFDPADEGYFAIDTRHDELIKLDPETGAVQPLGSVSGYDINTMVYDPVARQLYGIDYGTLDFLRIDPRTAAVTVTSLMIYYHATLAIDPTTGDIYGYERERDLVVRIDPALGTNTILMNSLFPGAPDRSFTLNDMTYDPIEDRLVGVGYERTNSGSGASFRDVIVTIDPDVRLSGQVKLHDELGGFGLGRNSRTGIYHLYSANQPLFELEIDMNVPSNAVDYRTVNGLWRRDYVAALYVESRDTIYATDLDSVYAIDPETGSTELLGSQPTGIRADDLHWDELRGLLGLRDFQTLSWVSPTAPWNERDRTTVAEYDRMASDPRLPTFFYGVTDGRLWTYDSTTGVSNPLTPTSVGANQVVQMAYVPEESAVYVATFDSVLHRIDVATGEWTEVGPLEFSILGLFAN